MQDTYSNVIGENAYAWKKSELSGDACRHVQLEEKDITSHVRSVHRVNKPVAVEFRLLQHPPLGHRCDWRDDQEQAPQTVEY